MSGRALVAALAALWLTAGAALAQDGSTASTPTTAAPAAEATTVSHGISAFGELAYPADFPHFGYAHPDAPKGGRIRLRPSIALRTFDGFNPWVLTGDAAAHSELLFDTLMARAYDEPDAMYGLLAETVEMPADRRFAIFTLRAEARFSDGSPVTAEDVVFSIEALKTNGIPQVSLPLADVARIEALDPRRVRVVFAEGARTRDLPAAVAEMPIFSKAFFATRDFTRPTLDAPPLGSGPYRVGRVAQGRTVEYLRRDDYWAKDLPVNRGRHNFDVVSVEYFGDDDIALQALSAGEVDFNEEFRALNWATKYTFPQIADGLVLRDTMADGRPGGTQGFFLNTRRTKLVDPRVREAIGLAFDFEWSNDKLFYDLYTRTDSFFENSDLAAEGMPKRAERALLEPFRAELPEAVFGPAVVPPVSDGSGADRRLLRRARKLLDEAGWTEVDGVRKNAAGETLELEFIEVAGGGFDRIIRPFIANLQQLGIPANLRALDAAQYESRRESYDFDLMVARLPVSATPGPELRGYLGSASRDAPGSFNLAGVASPAVDALLTAVETAASRDELRTATRALDRVFRAGHYWIPNWHKASHTIAYWDRFGRPQDLGLPKPAFERGAPELWWFDAAKSAALDAKRGG